MNHYLILHGRQLIVYNNELPESNFLFTIIMESNWYILGGDCVLGKTQQNSNINTK